MQNRSLSMFIGAMLVLGVGFVVYANKRSAVLPSINNSGTSQADVIQAVEDGHENENEDEGGMTQTTTPTTPAPATSPSGITLAQVATHNSRTSCWSAINGNVYDLTSWIPYHPGGEQNILIICGKDGSSAYNGQHGGRSRPATILAGFKIGVLAQ